MTTHSNNPSSEEADALNRTWGDIDKVKFFTLGPLFALGLMGVFHPLQVIKTRLQVSGSNMGLLIKEMAKKEGLRSFYKGFGPAIVGNCLTELIYFSTLEISKEQVLHTLDKTDVIQSKFSKDTTAHVVGGFSAEVISNSVIVPFDIIAQRLMMQVTTPQTELVRTTRLVYGGTIDAIRKIHNKEGIRGFFTGFNASLVTLGLEAAIWWGMYAVFKRQIYQTLDVKTESPLIHATAGFSAGVVTSLLINPLDVAKTRLQVQDHVDVHTAARYKGFLPTIAKIARQEGMRGLYAGVRAKILYFAPVTAISVTSFEILKYLSS